jgi:hypothetical protein
MAMLVQIFLLGRCSALVGSMLSSVVRRSYELAVGRGKGVPEYHDIDGDAYFTGHAGGTEHLGAWGRKEQRML